jgi:hypothetical protein
MQTQLDSVLIINENIRQIQRGLDECQHTFEILVEAFLHALDGVIQPQLITVAKIRDMMEESLSDGLDFPSFSSLELSRLITPVIFSQKLLLSVCSSDSIVAIYYVSIVQVTTLPR